MKAVFMHKRPSFELLKQSDIVTYYHLQFPCWLFDDERYAVMCLVAKNVYMLLFNRFQLSKHNGWMNDNGEVFVIYTRKELSGKLRVSEKIIKDAMDELKEHGLVWERRCGRGYANQIYLSRVTISNNTAINSKGGPLDPLTADALSTDTFAGESGDYDESSGEAYNESRPDEMAGLDFCPEISPAEESHGEQHNIGVSTSHAQEEPLKSPFMNRQNNGSRTVENAVQELPKQRSSYIDNKINVNKPHVNQSMSSQSKSSHLYTKPQNPDMDGLTDLLMLEELFEQSELEYLEDDEAKVIRDAIERLYYSDSIRVGNAIYPNSSIRSNLIRLDFLIIQDALSRFSRNQDKIKNSSAYVTVVLFNTIMESRSDLIVDPYLNYLRRDKVSGSSGGDRGP